MDSKGVENPENRHTEDRYTEDRRGSDAGDLRAFQRLIDQATADGYLARWDAETILAAMIKGQAFSAAKCALFRQLQERVWRAEIYLDTESPEGFRG
jgi:hypothetical protein